MTIKDSIITSSEYELISKWLDSHFYHSIGITFFLNQTQVSNTQWKLLRLYESDSSNVLLGVAILITNGTCFWLSEENSEANKLCRAILDLRPSRIMTTSFGRDLLHSSLEYCLDLSQEYNQWAMINTNQFPEAKNSRIARLTDIPFLTDYQHKYNEERLVEEFPDWEELISKEKIIVYEFNGEIVSVVRFGIETNRIVTLGGVYTFPSYRGKGFAEELLKFAINSIVSNGRIAYLIVDVDNTPAFNLYSKIGFKTVGIHYTGYPKYE